MAGYEMLSASVNAQTQTVMNVNGLVTIGTWGCVNIARVQSAWSFRPIPWINKQLYQSGDSKGFEPVKPFRQ
jgi:hypothetical protein